MTTIVTRTGKGSPLTHVEVDTNFTNLNTNKLETAAIPLGTAAAPSISFSSDANTGIYSPGADQLAVATNGTSRLSIDASGNVAVDTNTLYVDAGNNRVGIGTTSPAATLDVVGTANITSTGATLTLDRTGGGEALLYLKKAGATGGLIGTTGNSDITFYNGAGSERARIDSSGRLLVGTSTANTSGAKLQTSDGLTFPATQVASADPNTLDDYEEGTWTPGQGTGVTAVGTFSSVGRYTKIGRVVNYEGYISAVTSVAFDPAGGNLTTGLPFTVVAGSGTNGTAVNGSATVFILLSAGGTVVSGSALIAATSVIYFSGQYIV